MFQVDKISSMKIKKNGQLQFEVHWKPCWLSYNECAQYCGTKVTEDFLQNWKQSAIPTHRQQHFGSPVHSSLVSSTQPLLAKSPIASSPSPHGSHTKQQKQNPPASSPKNHNGHTLSNSPQQFFLRSPNNKPSAEPQKLQHFGQASLNQNQVQSPKDLRVPSTLNASPSVMKKVTTNSEQSFVASPTAETMTSSTTNKSLMASPKQVGSSSKVQVKMTNERKDLSDSPKTLLKSIQLSTEGLKHLLATTIPNQSSSSFSSSTTTTQRTILKMAQNLSPAGTTQMLPSINQLLVSTQASSPQTVFVSKLQKSSAKHLTELLTQSSKQSANSKDPTTPNRKMASIGQNSSTNLRLSDTASAKQLSFANTHQPSINPSTPSHMVVRQQYTPSPNVTSPSPINLHLSQSPAYPPVKKNTSSTPNAKLSSGGNNVQTPTQNVTVKRKLSDVSNINSHQSTFKVSTHTKEKSKIVVATKSTQQSPQLQAGSPQQQNQQIRDQQQQGGFSFVKFLQQTDLMLNQISPLDQLQKEHSANNSFLVSDLLNQNDSTQKQKTMPDQHGQQSKLPGDKNLKLLLKEAYQIQHNSQQNNSPKQAPSQKDDMVHQPSTNDLLSKQSTKEKLKDLEQHNTDSSPKQPAQQKMKHQKGLQPQQKNKQPTKNSSSTLSKVTLQQKKPLSQVKPPQENNSPATERNSPVLSEHSYSLASPQKATTTKHVAAAAADSKKKENDVDFAITPSSKTGAKKCDERTDPKEAKTPDLKAAKDQTSQREESEKPSAVSTPPLHPRLRLLNRLKGVSPSSVATTPSPSPSRRQDTKSSSTTPALNADKAPAAQSTNASKSSTTTANSSQPIQSTGATFKPIKSSAETDSTTTATATINDNTPNKSHSTKLLNDGQTGVKSVSKGNIKVCPPRKSWSPMLKPSNANSLLSGGDNSIESPFYNGIPLPPLPGIDELLEENSGTPVKPSPEDESSVGGVKGKKILKKATKGATIKLAKTKQEKSNKSNEEAKEKSNKLNKETKNNNVIDNGPKMTGQQQPQQQLMHPSKRKRFVSSKVKEQFHDDDGENDGTQTGTSTTKQMKMETTLDEGKRDKSDQSKDDGKDSLLHSHQIPKRKQTPNKKKPNEPKLASKQKQMVEPKSPTKRKSVDDNNPSRNNTKYPKRKRRSHVYTDDWSTSDLDDFEMALNLSLAEDTNSQPVKKPDEKDLVADPGPSTQDEEHETQPEDKSPKNSNADVPVQENQKTTSNRGRCQGKSIEFNKEQNRSSKRTSSRMNSASSSNETLNTLNNDGDPVANSAQDHSSTQRRTRSRRNSLTTSTTSGKTTAGGNGKITNDTTKQIPLQSTPEPMALHPSKRRGRPPSAKKIKQDVSLATKTIDQEKNKEPPVDKKEQVANLSKPTFEEEIYQPESLRPRRNAKANHQNIKKSPSSKEKVEQAPSLQNDVFKEPSGMQNKEQVASLPKPTFEEEIYKPESLRPRRNSKVNQQVIKSPSSKEKVEQAPSLQNDVINEPSGIQGEEQVASLPKPTFEEKIYQPESLRPRRHAKANHQNIKKSPSSKEKVEQAPSLQNDVINEPIEMQNKEQVASLPKPTFEEEIYKPESLRPRRNSKVNQQVIKSPSSKEKVEQAPSLQNDVINEPSGIQREEQVASLPKPTFEEKIYQPESLRPRRHAKANHQNIKKSPSSKEKVEQAPSLQNNVINEPSGLQNKEQVASLPKPTFEEEIYQPESLRPRRHAKANHQNIKSASSKEKVEQAPSFQNDVVKVTSGLRHKRSKSNQKSSVIDQNGQTSDRVVVSPDHPKASGTVVNRSSKSNQEPSPTDHENIRNNKSFEEEPPLDSQQRTTTTTSKRSSQRQSRRPGFYDESFNMDDQSSKETSPDLQSSTPGLQSSTPELQSSTHISTTENGEVFSQKNKLPNSCTSTQDHGKGEQSNPDGMVLSIQTDEKYASEIVENSSEKNTLPESKESKQPSSSSQLPSGRTPSGQMIISQDEWDEIFSDTEEEQDPQNEANDDVFTHITSTKEDVSQPDASVPIVKRSKSGRHQSCFRDVSFLLDSLSSEQNVYNFDFSTRSMRKRSNSSSNEEPGSLSRDSCSTNQKLTTPHGSLRNFNLTINALDSLEVLMRKLIERNLKLKL